MSNSAEKPTRAAPAPLANAPARRSGRLSIPSGSPLLALGVVSVITIWAVTSNAAAATAVLVVLGGLAGVLGVLGVVFAVRWVRRIEDEADYPEARGTAFAEGSGVMRMGAGLTVEASTTPRF